MQDERLLARALAGDEEAFVALLDLFEQPMYVYFRRRGVPQADAEDLTQQVFLAVLECAGRFDPQRGTFRAFLYGIARRKWLKRAAEAGRIPMELLDDVVDASDAAPDSHAQRAERQALFKRAIEELPEAARQVWELRVNGSLAVSEVAGILEMHPNTVKSHLFRARARLRAYLGARLGLEED